jgi:hypothetical protein
MGLRSSSLEICRVKGQPIGRSEGIRVVLRWGEGSNVPIGGVRGRRRRRHVEERTVGKTNLELGVGPARDLNDHVQDGLLLVGVEGDVVEGGDGDAILLDVDAVLQSVGSGDLAQGVGGSHFGQAAIGLT